MPAQNGSHDHHGHGHSQHGHGQGNHSRNSAYQNSVKPSGEQRTAPVDHQEEFYGVYANGRLMQAGISLLGKVVRLQTKEKKCFEGIFRTFSRDFEVALEVVHEVHPGQEDQVPSTSMISPKMIFKQEEIVKVEGTPDIENISKSSFATDSDIRKANGQIDIHRQLEKWIPDEAIDEDLNFESETTLVNVSGNTAKQTFLSTYQEGWSPEAMFDYNKQKFAVKSDFNENMYHTAEINIDLSNAADQEKLRQAEYLAELIESDPASKRAAALENEDEERDIVQRSSGSSASNSTATTPTSAVTVNIMNRYQAPPKRSVPGNERAGRNTRRGGGPGNSFQTMRNATGDVRGQMRNTGRDYCEQNYSSNKYYRSSHYQQPVMTQGSHERSPAIGGGTSNEWDRRGPRRQDIRDNCGPSSASTSAPQAGPARSMQMPNSQSSGDNNTAASRRNVAGSKGTTRVDDLKSFHKDFHLSPNEGMNANATSSHVEKSAISASTRVIQVSPTQQLPPTSIPPPQHRQTRSPEGKSQQQTQQSQQPQQQQQQQAPPIQNHVMSHTQPPPPIPPQKVNQISPVQAHAQPPMVRPEMTRMISSDVPLAQQMPPEFSHMRPRPPPASQVMVGPVMVTNPPPPKAPVGAAHLQQSQMSNQPPVVGSQMPPVPPVSQPVQQQTMQAAEAEQKKPDDTESVKVHKLNPDAEEFRPRLYQSVPPPPQQGIAQISNQAYGAYPVPVQSPPQTGPILQQQPSGYCISTNAMGVPIGTAYQPPQVTSVMSVQYQQNGPPLYTIQAGQPAAVAIIQNTAGHRPRGVVSSQPAVAAATGQPIMAAPYGNTQPYIVQFPPSAGANQQHPSATSTMYPSAYVMGTTRMGSQQYIVQAAAGQPSESMQHTMYAMPQMYHMPPGPYQANMQLPPQAAGQHQHVAVSLASGGAPNGNNHSHTPPTPQPNPSPASLSAGQQPPAAAPANMTYPPNVPTPQSPPYTGAQYPQGPQLVMLPSNSYVAGPQIYSGQGALTAVHHPTAAPPHPYAPGTQHHFVPMEFAQYAAAAAQHAVVAHQMQQVGGFHPAMLRSSSVPTFVSGSIVSVASGPGAPPPASHPNNHA